MNDIADSDDDSDRLSQEVDAHFEQLLKHVIREAWKSAKTDQISRALVFLLVRVSNTWLSIRTLRHHSPHKEVFVVDAGTLLRAMFDAYLQAEYIAAEPESASERASDYFEFEHIERYKLQTKVLKYDNWLTQRLRSSPKAVEGKKAVKQEYERVKRRFPANNSKKRHDPGVRSQWYQGRPEDIAKLLNKSDEYDIFLTTLHGCVHSSAIALRPLSPISAQNVIHWASMLAARVARLNVDHNGIVLNDLHRQILDALSRPYGLLQQSDEGQES